MTVDRRQFMKSAAATLLAFGINPLALAARKRGAIEAPPRKRAKRLLLIELEGGNDALATFQPLRSATLTRLRPTLLEATDSLIHLDDRYGLCRALEAIEPQWRSGRMRVLPQIGYQPIDRSHFRSMDIWHSGQPESPDARDGWIGRAVARAQETGRNLPSLIHLADGPMPLLFSGGSGTVLHLTNPQALALPGRRLNELSRLNEPGASPESEARFLAEATQETLELSRKLATEPIRDLDGNGLDARLAIAADLSALLPEDLVFYCRLGGFDSHAAQRDSQPALLRSLAQALAALDADFRDERRGEFTVLVFSEFGRRIAENANRGTDHGAGGLAIVLGSRVEGGIAGRGIDPDDQIAGDLNPRIDFRSVYRSLAEDFLGLSAAGLDPKVQKLELFRPS